MGGGLPHELEHAYQFETGQLDFSRVSGGPGFLYDIGDEVTAYRRQTAYTGGDITNMDVGFVRALKNSGGNLLYNKKLNGNLSTGSTLGPIDLMWRMQGVNPFTRTIDINKLGKKHIDVSNST